MKKTFLFTIIMVLFLISCKTKNTDKVSPYLNFEKGFSQTLVYETITSAIQMGSMQESNEILFVLDSITADSSYIFTGKVTHVKYSSDIFGEKENFDSNRLKSINTMSQTELDLYNEIKSYLNKEFVIILDKQGNLLKKARYNNNIILDPIISEGYTIAPVIFPNEKLYVDYTWEQNVANPSIKSQESKFNYTVADITDDRIILDVIFKIGAVEGLLKENEARGSYEIDRKTKRFIKGERVMKIQTTGGKAIYSIYEK
jgi:hypothetical protein